MTKIALAGDFHLGKRQYNSPIRERDFQKAWLNACQMVAGAAPDFFVITGDLFDKKIIDPVTLSVAVEGLSTPGLGTVLAIEGNHDNRSYTQKGRSWLEFLEDQGHIDQILRPGKHYQKGCLAFFGFPWAGRETDTAFSNMVWEATLLGAPFSIGVIHGAPEGYIMGAGTISSDLLAQHKDDIDLLLMGHCHKPFVVNDHIFCGGSLESCSLDEIDYSGNIFFISVDEEGVSGWEKFSYPKRIFTVVELDSSDLENLSNLTYRDDEVIIANIVGERRKINREEIRMDIEHASGSKLVRVVDRMESVSFSPRETKNTKTHDEIMSELLGDKVPIETFHAVFDAFSSRDEQAVVDTLTGGCHD